MIDQWNFYLYNVNDSLASIYLNMGLAIDAPIDERHLLLWVWIYMKTPRDDGLSSSEESPRLQEVEDALIVELQMQCGAQFAGRITTLGRREFYFYGASRDALERSIRKALENYPRYEFSFGSQEDAGWKQYFDVLYPPQEEIQRMGNRDVLESLARDGDVHSLARMVDHLLYFSSDAGRSLFCEEVRKDGFELARLTKGEGELAFGVELNRLHSVEQETIDAIALNLLRSAKRFGGEYDGWGCTATSD
jgi:uncharacterized protein (TIGR01619 family)